MSSPPPITLTPNARRPDAGGTQGRPLQVKANFFAIKKLPVDSVWHYDVSITPELPAARARKLWKEIEKLEELSKTKAVFDGRCNAYSAVELDFGKAAGITRKVVLPDGTPPKPAVVAASSSKQGPTGPKKGTAKKGTSAQDSPGPKQKTVNEFMVKISRVARIDLEELHRFIRKEGPVTPACFAAIQGSISCPLCFLCKPGFIPGRICTLILIFCDYSLF